MTRQSVTHRLHERMHQLPGVPEHSNAESLSQRVGRQNRPLKNRPLQNRTARINQNRGEPKVLVGWQNAIGRFFSRREE